MIKKILLDLLYPPVCIICSRPLESGKGICPACEKKLSWIESPRCMRCGKPIMSDIREYCPDCAKRERYFDGGLGVFLYPSAITPVIVGLKKNRNELAEHYLGICMAACIRPFLDVWMPECIVPIPLDQKRMKKRGYNQARLLAAQIAVKLDIPLDVRLLFRVEKREEQKKLNRMQRQKNLQDAFYTRKKELPASVLLVDDVFTTGSTMEAASKALKTAGVLKVYYVTACMVAEV